jgi:uncharacterized protein YegP (UPF0339 family)
MILVYQDEDKHWRWQVTAKNKRVLANSAEGYKRRIDCVRALQSVRLLLNNHLAQVEEQLRESSRSRKASSKS